MSHEEKILKAVTVLSERMKWVIRIGSILMCALSAGYIYQVNMNLANATDIESNRTEIRAHIETVDKLHNLLMKEWIINDRDN